MKHTLLLPFAILTGSAAAQNFNVDFAATNIPDPNYGADGLAGIWNGIDTQHCNAPASLVDLSGTPRPVTLSLSGTMCDFSGDPDCQQIAGDYELLDGINVDIIETITIEGLLPGRYEVRGYAHHGDNPFSDIKVIGEVDSDCMYGSCSVSSATGLNYTQARFWIDVPYPGTLVIDFESVYNFCGNQSPHDFVMSGLQLERTHHESFGNVGTSYCTSEPNSTGSEALISATGTRYLTGELVMSYDDLTLSASPVPSNEVCMFMYGTQQTQLPYYNGFLCIAGTGLRLDPFVSGSNMTMSQSIDFGVAQITAGQTLNFQAFFRDVAAAGAFANLSDATQITFAP